MTPTAAIELVTAHVETAWNAASFSLPVPGSPTPSTAVPPLAFGNEAFTPPAGAAAWALATVRETQSRQRTIGPIGSRKFERGMALIFSLGVPQNVGDAASAALMGIVRTIVEGVKLVGLDPFRAAIVRRVVPTPPWLITVVEIPFSYAERK